MEGARCKHLQPKFFPTANEPFFKSKFLKLDLFSIHLRYTFFSTGIFMGITTMLIVLIILFAGFSILGSLQTPSKFPDPNSVKKK
jgi:hypothetical protein